MGAMNDGATPATASHTAMRAPSAPRPRTEPHPASAPPPPSCTRGPLISVDGITGIGKTYLTLRAIEALHTRPMLLQEFSRRSDAALGLGNALLGALIEASAGDPFLRGGTPEAETLLLLAIKRHDLDTVVPALTRGRTVVEGRSVDTTAVCQALQLHPHDRDAALEEAVALRDLAASYRPLPDLTILVTDEPSEAVTRAQQRDRCVFTSEQVTFMRDAGALFERLAATDPTRYRIVDRRRADEYEAADMIRAWIEGAGSNLGCLHEPWQGPPARCICCGADSAAA
jgi:dTMP kinase